MRAYRGSSKKTELSLVTAEGSWARAEFIFYSLLGAHMLRSVSSYSYEAHMCCV
jgi:hypothetical protein